MNSFRRGFTLPSTLVASLIMLMLLLSALSLLTTTRRALEEQHYGLLAAEAAESGIRMAEDCIQRNQTVTWTSAKPLKPNTNCHGDPVSGQDPHVIQMSNIATTFSVEPISSLSGQHSVNSLGQLNLIRASDGEVWRTVDRGARAEITGNSLLATSVSSGLYQVCAVLSDRTWCNGGNNSGQMGNGRVESLSTMLYLKPEPVLREEGNLLGKKDKIVIGGTGRTCTVTTDNSIYCWGSSGYGTMGIGYSPPNPQTTPIEVAKPPGMTGEVTGIASGWNATCAISGGNLWCWGRNNSGQLGINSTATQLSPARVQGIGTYTGKPVTDIASSVYSDTFCAVAGGDAYCWGSNTYGQIGDNSTTTRMVPTAVAKQGGQLAGKTVIKVINASAPRVYDGQIALTDGEGGVCTPSNRDCYVQANSCALTSDGQMYCWGANRYGQMGQGYWSTANQLTPIRVAGALNGKFVRDIAGSYRTPCALTTEPDSGNRLYCWGGNHIGAGGLGHSNACNNSPPSLQSICSPSPVVMQTPGLANKHIASIHAGVNRMCAIADSISYCAGLNTNAQIGDGTTINRNVPTEASVFRIHQPPLVY